MFHYMSYWYAGLFVVVEGWRDLGLQDAEIDGLLESPTWNCCAGTATACFLSG